MTPDALAAGLRRHGFVGALYSDGLRRAVSGTDNSVYQEPPDVVAEPAVLDDLDRCVAALAAGDLGEAGLRPRGGGTGTNGQSLGSGVALDSSARLTAIEAIDPHARTATVQPGVVLDQLNAAAAPYGLALGPVTSTSSRATLGGMIATNAAGMGSRVYGDTSDNIVALELLLADGTRTWSRAMDAGEAAQAAQRGDAFGRLVAAIRDVLAKNRGEIATAFPATPRRLTGYDLARAGGGEGGVDVNRLVAGSEGTLALIRRAVVRLVPRARDKHLVVVRYPSFDDALADAHTLLQGRPSAVETMDATCTALARGEPTWPTVAPALADDAGYAQAANFVNFTEAGSADPAGEADDLVARIRAGEGRAAGCYRVSADEQATFWSVRARAVGLLGNMPGRRKPVAFVEDCGVPPAHLAAFNRDFRAALDAAGLSYGMFGHVDAGCLHVRPALDMADPGDRAQLRPLTDRIHRLALSYGGILWGEHGKGYRGEYADEIFGATLYRALGRLKAAADPDNRLNPGKIVAPQAEKGAVTPLDGAQMRGQRDVHVPDSTAESYSDALNCNGNGVCFHWDARERICPSFKATRDRLHSPKGRATALRTWLTELGESQLTPDTAPKGAARETEQQVHAALDGCLGCKACTGQCPLHVNIPELKARFLHAHHKRYRRPVADYLIGGAEAGAAYLASWPRLANAAMAVGRPVTAAAGLVALPRFARPSLAAGLARRGLKPLAPAAIAAATRAEALTADDAAILVQDGFTTPFDPAPLLAACDLLHALGLRVFVAAYRPWGKAQHVKGFLGALRRTAQRQADRLAALAETGLPLVGLEASCILMSGDEYASYAQGGARVALIDRFLAARRDRLRARGEAPGDGDAAYGLGVHCSEASADAAAGQRWADIFAAAGLSLTPEPVGCCGMAGSYGHERRHQATSQALFAMSWQAPAQRYGPDRWLATGFSCREQTARLGPGRPRHPVEALAAHLA